MKKPAENQPNSVVGRLAKAAALLLLLLSAVVVALLSAESGFRLAVRSAGWLAGPFFSAEQAEGSLLAGLRLGKVRIRIAGKAEVDVDEFSFKWNPGALLAKQLHLGRVAARGLTVRLAESAPRKTADKKSGTGLPQVLLPLGLRLDELQVRDCQIFLPGRSAPLVVDELFVKASGQGTQVVIDRLLLDSPDYGADLRGKADFSDRWPLQVGGSWRVADPGIGDLAGSLEVQGTLDDLAVAVALATPAKAALQGKVVGLPDDLRWEASLKTGHFKLRDIKVDAPVEGSLTVVRASGTADSYGGVLAADVQWQGFPKVQAEAKVAAADYSGLKVDYLTVRHEDAELTVRGDMAWKDGFSWKAELEGKEVDPSLAAAQWPGRISGLVRSRGQLMSGGQAMEVGIDGVHGELAGRPFSLDASLKLKDQVVTIEKLMLRSKSGSINVSGRAAADGPVDLAVQAEAGQLADFVPGWNGVGQLKVLAAGSKEQSAITLSLTGSSLKFQERRLPSLQADLAGDLVLQGNGQGLVVRDCQLLLAGRSALKARGQIGWGNGLAWQADVQAEQLDPSLLAPEWPGSVNAALRSSGRKSAAGLAADLSVDELQGQLRGFPLAASGRAGLNGSVLTVDDLRLQSGSTHVQISGRADASKELALVFKAGSDDLASLAPAAKGSFQLEGTLSGSSRQPSLVLSANGSGLRMKEHALKSLKATVKADLAASGRIDAEVAADGLQIGKEQVKTVRLNVKGSTEQHRLEFSVDAGPRRASMAVEGGMKAQQWLGQLAELQLSLDQFGTWKTEKAAALNLSGSTCALSGLALRHDHGAKVAAAGTWDAAAGWQGEVQLDGLALHQLRTWRLPVPPQLNGTLTASASAQGKGALPMRARFAAVLPELILEARDYEDDGSMAKWRWQDSRLEVQLKDDALRLEAHSTFQDGSTAGLAVAASQCGDFSKPERMPLSGRLDVNIRDLRPLAPLADYAVQAEGEFGGRIDLHGTVARPRLKGTLALKDGASGRRKIHVPAAGINLKMLKLDVEGDGSANQVQLLVASGDGQIRVNGEVGRSPEHSLLADFSIKGEDFQAANLPEYQAVVSPDLRLVRSRTGTALSGVLTVPKARIAPVGFGGAISSSKDVVVVDRKGEPEKSTLPMSVDLSLALGRDVVVDSFGLKGFLDGGLKIGAKPDRAVTALGTLSLRDGTFDFEGTSLQLSEGRIFYQGGPIENPSLDIRASRKVNKIEAGIHLAGSVDNMEMKLFSDTSMDDSEILSWLLTGQNMSGATERKGDAALSPAAAALGKVGGGALLKSVNPLGVVDMDDAVDLSIGGGKESSDVSLVMGKEIYKDLYISYGKDLTGEGGSFKARYDLKYGFSVESETTSKTTGADLIWSLEK